MTGQSLTRESSDRSPSERVDVCVVGTGVAGALVAHPLARAGYDVVMLEAGPRFDPEERLEQMERALREDTTDSVWGMGGDRDSFSTSDGTDYALNGSRVKGVGGTTLHWAGYTPRYHEKDFEMQSRYGLASDWSIGYHDLKPYYTDAERALGVAGADDNPFAPPRDEPYPLPAFPAGPVDTQYEDACSNLDITAHSAPQARNSEAYDGRSKCLGYSTCTPVCPSGAKYSGDVHVRKAESEGARVIDRAPVQRLEHGPDGETIEAAVYNTPDQTELRQEARVFVVACGAIETPRLLLLSRSAAHPDGLANSSGLVGRYLMEHPTITVAGLIERPDGQEPIFWRARESHQFYDHEEPRPGSFKLNLNHEDPYSPLAALQGYESGLISNLQDPLAGDAWGEDVATAYADEATRHWRVSVDALVEMLPRRTNRVELDTSETDNHGNPVPDITLGAGTHAVATMERAQTVGTRILEEMGVDDVEYDDTPANPGYASHQMGTTRMGTDPDESVVDPQLRTHDVENLYVSSSSVFVTGGAMHPTLTIAALALRLADHLNARL